MSKDPARKGKRRKQPITDDPELLELAAVLAEYQLDNNAYGWFRPPWRDGEWALGLAKAAAFAHDVFDGADAGLIDEAETVIDEHPRDGRAYEHAGELYASLVQPNVNTNTSRLLAAALRCLQLKIANSHGGGSVYNEVLIPAFLPIRPDLVDWLVLDFRCNDAIGTSRQFKNDHNDRSRAAFSIAWKRGLYLAAYAVKPAH